MNELWLEIIKIAVPAIVSSGLVAYIFQKRLKRLGSYEKITNTIMERMLRGVENVFSNVRKINKILSELETLLARDPLNSAVLKNKQKELKRQHEITDRSVQAHRMYITALVPLGGSTPFYDGLVAIWLYLETLVGKLEKDADVSEVKSELVGAIKRWQKIYIQISGNLEDIQKKILNGQPVL